MLVFIANFFKNDVCFSVFGFQGTNHRQHNCRTGDGEIRTHDLLLARQALSQLSYTPKENGLK